MFVVSRSRFLPHSLGLVLRGAVLEKMAELMEFFCIFEKPHNKVCLMAKCHGTNMLEAYFYLGDYFSFFANTLLCVADHHQLLADVPAPPDGNEQLPHVFFDGVFRLGNEHHRL